MDELIGIGFDDLFLQRHLSSESLYNGYNSEHPLVGNEEDGKFDNQSQLTTVNDKKEDAELGSPVIPLYHKSPKKLTTINEQKDKLHVIRRADSRRHISSLRCKSPEILSINDEHNDELKVKTNNSTSPERSIYLKSPKKQVSSVIETKAPLPLSETPHRLSRSVPVNIPRRKYTTCNKAKMTKKSHIIWSSRGKTEDFHKNASSVKLKDVDDKIKDSFSPSPLDYKTAMRMFPSWMILDYGKDLLSKDDFARLKKEDKIVKPNKQSTSIIPGTRSTRAKYPAWMVDEYGRDLSNKEESNRRSIDKKRRYAVSPIRPQLAGAKAKRTKDKTTTSNLPESIPEVIYLEECNNGFKQDFTKRKGYIIQDPNNPNVDFRGSISTQSLSIDESVSDIDFSKRKGYILDNAANVEYKKLKLELATNIEKRAVENDHDLEYLNRQVLVDYIESDIDFSKRKGYVLNEVESTNNMQLIELAKTFNEKYKIPKGSISSSLTDLKLSKHGAAANNTSRTKGSKSLVSKSLGSKSHAMINRSASEKSQLSTQQEANKSTVPKKKYYYSYTNSAFKEELTDTKATLTKIKKYTAQEDSTKYKKDEGRVGLSTVLAQKKAGVTRPDLVNERGTMNSPIATLIFTKSPIYTMYHNTNLLAKPPGTATYTGYKE